MNKKYDLEERTFEYARQIRILIRELPKNMINHEDGRQLVRASGSVGANYIEANEKLGSKDFLMRARISRKEAKECLFFLRLLKDGNPSFEEKISGLVEEGTAIKKILSAIINKYENGNKL